MKYLMTILMLLTLVSFVVPTATLAADPTPAAEQMAKVSINAASAVELQRLPGVGKVTAERIVAYRNANGPFASVDDLIKVKGIGKKSLAKLQPLVTL